MKTNSRTLIITGGAGSIGSDCIPFLQTRFGEIIVLDKIKPSVRDISFFQVDCSDSRDVKKAFDYLGNHYNLDRSVCWLLAGKIHNELSISITDGLSTHSEPNWNSVIESNLSATFFCGISYAQMLIKSGLSGLLVNTGSLSANGQAGQAAYAAAKAGVRALTTVWAQEFAPFGVRVAELSPGVVMSNHLGELGEVVCNNILRQTPLDRFVTPADVARSIIYFDDCSSFHGRRVELDCGYNY